MKLLVVAALAVAALAAVTRVRLEPSPVVPADAATDTFSGERALAILHGIVGDHPMPHPVGTAEHDRVAERIVAALQRLGYQPRREAHTSCSARAVCAPVTNIVAELAGTSQDVPILATAHYDSVAISPGVSDDGAGCAALLEIAAALRAGPPPRHRVVLLFSDGEELGLLGARAFVDHGDLAATPYTVVNVESRGVAGPSLMFQTSHANNALIHAFAGAPHPIGSSVFPTFYELIPNDTDLTVYLGHGAAGINYAFVGSVVYYHSARDDLDHLDPRSLQHQGESALAVVRALANDDDDGDIHHLDTGPVLVYFDVLGSFVVWWPVGVAQIGSLALIALLIATVRAARSPAANRAAWRARLAGFGFAIARVVAVAVVGFAIARAARATGVASWPAHPAPLLAAVMLAAVAIVALAFAPSGHDAWFGGLAGFIAMTIAFAWTLPGMSYMAMVTAAVGCTATLVEAMLRRRGGAQVSTIAPDQRYPIARLITTVAAALVWLPLGWLVFDTLGLDGLPVFALCVVQPVACWMGVLAERRTARRIAGGAAALAALAFVVGIAMPRYTADAPQRLAVQRVHDLTTDRAWWTMRYDGKPPSVIPAELVDDATREQLLPWEQPALAAPAPVTAVVAPRLAIASDTKTETGRRITGTLISPRGATAIRVGFPPGTAIRSLRIAGQRVEPARWKASSGKAGARSSVGGAAPVDDWGLVTFVGLPADGVDIDIELELGSPAQLTLRIVDQLPAGLLSGGSDSPFAVPPDDVVPSGDDDVVIAQQTL